MLPISKWVYLLRDLLSCITELLKVICMTDILMVSCKKGPTCHAYAWQIGALLVGYPRMPSGRRVCIPPTNRTIIPLWTSCIVRPLVYWDIPGRVYLVGYLLATLCQAMPDKLYKQENAGIDKTLYWISPTQAYLANKFHLNQHLV